MTRLAAILTCLALVGCDAEGARVQAVEVGPEFTLAPGESVSVKAADMKVRFVAVIEDSRCPKNLTCIWAGQVKVQLEVQVASQAASPMEIVEGTTAPAGEYRVTLVRVGPEPLNGAEIAPQDYRATLKVERPNR
jgi:hypothetical protein